MAATFTALPAGAATPIAATCGAVLTTDAYLAADLVCTGRGLTLARDVTLDLRGHRLGGAGKVGTVVNGGQTAITVTSGFSPTVKNGRIDHWGVGLRAQGAFPDAAAELAAADESTVTVASVSFTDNVDGINAVDDGNPPVVTFDVSQSRFERNTVGYFGAFHGVLQVDQSVFLDNTTSGIDVSEGRGTTITNSRLESSGTGLHCGDFCTVSGSTIKDNTVGIVTDNGRAAVSDSTLSGNDTGVKVDYLGTAELSGNTLTGNSTAVVVDEYGTVTASNNRLTDNTFGFTLGPAFEGGGAKSLTLTGNYLGRNGDGIYLPLSQDNGDTAGVQGNLATHNTRYGVYAPGADDQGGNRAGSNGKPCTGVVCARVYRASVSTFG